MTREGRCYQQMTPALSTRQEAHYRMPLLK